MRRSKNDKLFSIFLNEQISDYVEKKSDELGLSKSAFIRMCIATYKIRTDE